MFVIGWHGAEKYISVLIRKDSWKPKPHSKYAYNISRRAKAVFQDHKA